MDSSIPLPKVLPTTLSDATIVYVVDSVRAVEFLGQTIDAPIVMRQRAMSSIEPHSPPPARAARLFQD